MFNNSLIVSIIIIAGIVFLIWIYAEISKLSDNVSNKRNSISKPAPLIKYDLLDLVKSNHCCRLRMSLLKVELVCINESYSIKGEKDLFFTISIDISYRLLLKLLKEFPKELMNHDSVKGHHEKLHNILEGDFKSILGFILANSYIYKLATRNTSTGSDYHFFNMPSEDVSSVMEIEKKLNSIIYQTTVFLEFHHEIESFDHDWQKRRFIQQIISHSWVPKSQWDYMD